MRIDASKRLRESVWTGSRRNVRDRYAKGQFPVVFGESRMVKRVTEWSLSTDRLGKVWSS